jgi:MFS family permease
MASKTPAPPIAETAATATARPGLWANPDFLKLWAGQSLSLFGSQVTIFALPLVAVVMLDATAGQMGLLGALARAPFVLFLFAGVWADRYRRRPTMIWTDFGRFVLIGLLPMAWFAGVLSLTWLYVVALLVGVLGVFFEVANQAYLPSLVGSEHIAEGNAKMQISTSIAQVSGPSLGAGLLAVFSAASLLIVDAISYLFSGVASVLIRRPEESPGGTGRNPHVFAAMGAGILWVWRHRLMRPMLLAITLFMLFGTGIQVQYVLYARRTLNLSPSLIAVTFAMLGLGAIVGSTMSLRVLRRIGPGPAAFWATAIGNVVLLLIPAATGPTWLRVGMLSAAQVITGATAPIAMVGMGSLRMHLTPNNMQGRVVATFRGLSLGLAPVGALISGVLGSAIGLRPTMYVLALGVLAPPLVILFSPVAGTRAFPAPPTEAT